MSGLPSPSWESGAESPVLGRVPNRLSLLTGASDSGRDSPVGNRPESSRVIKRRSINVVGRCASPGPSWDSSDRESPAGRAASPKRLKRLSLPLMAAANAAKSPSPLSVSWEGKRHSG